MNRDFAQLARLRSEIASLNRVRRPQCNFQRASRIEIRDH